MFFLESYYNVKDGKYGLVNLKECFGKVLMFEMELVDIWDKFKKKKMIGYFSD